MNTTATVYTTNGTRQLTGSSFFRIMRQAQALANELREGVWLHSQAEGWHAVRADGIFDYCVAAELISGVPFVAARVPFAACVAAVADELRLAADNDDALVATINVAVRHAPAEPAHPEATWPRSPAQQELLDATLAVQASGAAPALARRVRALLAAVQLATAPVTPEVIPRSDLAARQASQRSDADRAAVMHLAAAALTMPLQGRKL